jgi:hypothetical protein
MRPLALLLVAIVAFRASICEAGDLFQIKTFRFDFLTVHLDRNHPIGPNVSSLEQEKPSRCVMRRFANHGHIADAYNNRRNKVWLVAFSDGVDFLDIGVIEGWRESMFRGLTGKQGNTGTEFSIVFCFVTPAKFDDFLFREIGNGPDIDNRKNSNIFSRRKTVISNSYFEWNAATLSQIEGAGKLDIDGYPGPLINFESLAESIVSRKEKIRADTSSYKKQNARCPQYYGPVSYDPFIAFAFWVFGFLVGLAGLWRFLRHGNIGLFVISLIAASIAGFVGAMFLV